MELATHIDELVQPSNSVDLQVTLQSPFVFFECCWALPGECMGSELVVCEQLFIERVFGSRAF
jgi:hypothetical protein